MQRSLIALFALMFSMALCHDRMTRPIGRTQSDSNAMSGTNQCDSPNVVNRETIVAGTTFPISWTTDHLNVANQYQINIAWVPVGQARSASAFNTSITQYFSYYQKTGNVTVPNVQGDYVMRWGWTYITNGMMYGTCKDYEVTGFDANKPSWGDSSAASSIQVGLIATIALLAAL
eukprot:TRINITY_DN3514_c1_g1_i1.p1 TRINITY_DN3514_c1_g1~~TRINITY_DN3514_c1_g1_i1.p1  ORF type:complete len:175 (-),score=40.61 TRINITY_DN3514_c1_g1_i1:82-606(-)